MNNQAKAKFQMLYLGQNVYRYNEHIDHTYEVVGGHAHADYIKDSYLLLRSVEDLTDDEAIKLATIVIEEPFDRYRRLTVTRDKRGEYHYITVSHKNVRYRFCIDCFFVNFAVYDMEDTISGEIDMKPYACIDYLRSIGICLPITCLDENNVPVTYDPVEEKWAVIENTKNK